MRYTFDTSKLVNNFMDEEQPVLSAEDQDAFDRLYDNYLDAEEYAYFYRTANGQKELQF